jgi:hypothetical protein
MEILLLSVVLRGPIVKSVNGVCIYPHINEPWVVLGHAGMACACVGLFIAPPNGSGNFSSLMYGGYSKHQLQDILQRFIEMAVFWGRSPWQQTHLILPFIVIAVSLRFGDLFCDRYIRNINVSYISLKISPEASLLFIVVRKVSN